MKEAAIEELKHQITRLQAAAVTSASGQLSYQQSLPVMAAHLAAQTRALAEWT